MNPVPADASHSSASDISAYLDRTLSAGDRTRVEAHLADCSECRQEVVELSRLLRSRPARHSIGRWAVAAGIAATLAIIVGLPSGPDAPPVQPPEVVERGLRAEEGLKLSAWGPTRGVSVRRDSLVLAWKPNASGSGPQYHLTLSNAEGSILWTASTPDTMLMPPPSLILPGGRTYYWYTDALLPDGRSLSTGVQEFRLVP